MAQKANTPDVLRGLVVHDDVIRLIGCSNLIPSAAERRSRFSASHGVKFCASMLPLPGFQMSLAFFNDAGIRSLIAAHAVSSARLLTDLHL